MLILPVGSRRLKIHDDLLEEDSHSHEYLKLLYYQLKDYIGSISSDYSVKFYEKLVAEFLTQRDRHGPYTVQVDSTSAEAIYLFLLKYIRDYTINSFSIPNADYRHTIKKCLNGNINFIEVTLKRSKKQQTLMRCILLAGSFAVAGIGCGASLWFGHANIPLFPVIFPFIYGIIGLLVVLNNVRQLIMLQISAPYDKDYFYAMNCFEASTTESLEHWNAEKKPSELGDGIDPKTNDFFEKLEWLCPLVAIIKKTKKYKELSKKAHYYQWKTILSSLSSEFSETYPLYDDINEIITDYSFGSSKSPSIS